MNIIDKQLIIFDLDGTLAPSKSPIDAAMAGLLMKLLEHKKVAIMSGGGYPQFQTQLLTALPHDSNNFGNLLLLPTSGTRLYVWKGEWVEKYAEHFELKEKEKVTFALKAALTQAGYEPPVKTFGDIIEDRGSQITFSALGQNAPLDLKSAWDPTREKRQKIISCMDTKIPEFDMRIGGTSSIDITKKGVNKAYGIRKLEEYLKLAPDSLIFVGDALFRGGNDYPVKAIGIDTIQVSGPEESKTLIASWLG